MRNTKLILIEGVPGSGKSTLAQFITHSLTRLGISCRWWYEEEKNHPVYVFHDRASLKYTVDLLSSGYHLQVIEKAIDKWRTFAQFDASRLALENSAGDWSTYERNVLDFLDLHIQEDASVSSCDLERFIGTYHHEGGEDQQASCHVQIEHNHLIIDGIPQVWPRTRLIPISRNVLAFAIESLPFHVAFEEDARGVIDRMIVTGPELLSGSVDCIFFRERNHQ